MIGMIADYFVVLCYLRAIKIDESAFDDIEWNTTMYAGFSQLLSQVNDGLIIVPCSCEFENYRLKYVVLIIYC